MTPSNNTIIHEHHTASSLDNLHTLNLLLTRHTLPFTCWSDGFLLQLWGGFRGQQPPSGSTGP
ncbi:uncharacterized protein N7483_004002 [Penicillium malachiteum]|uniref:uncharacterized protein n=1 Tax=Penicillium malachiteum TaxID=1324776 RepID=UPI0025468C49|nr:uncharacterized protein N7483_004002 [Penicillium malachiteum]KAJ5729494.1 hypothetical protein N7483_004002 [Penicillium malachiteum]